MLDFFIEDEVKKSKDGGHRDAEPMAKTDMLGRLQAQEVVMATTENFFWATYPETEGDKMEALGYVFGELGLRDDGMGLDEEIAVGVGDGGCMCESAEGDGDEVIRARFEEMELRE
jgi:hypothetical protein